MGFSNEQRGGGGKFINFRKGKLVNGGNEFLHFTGALVDIGVDEGEYKGETYKRITLYMVDLDTKTLPLYHVQAAMNSGHMVAFMSMLPNIDHAKPFEISPGVRKSEDGQKEFANLFINQGGNHIKWYYKSTNEDKKKKFPEPKIVPVGTKKVKDYTEREDFFEKLIVDFLNKKLRKLYPDGHKSFKAAAGTAETTGTTTGKGKEDAPEIDDDLPF